MNLVALAILVTAIISALGGGVLGYQWNEGQVKDLELAVERFTSAAIVNEQNSERDRKQFQERIDTLTEERDASVAQRIEDIRVMDARLDEVASKVRIALSATTVRLLNSRAGHPETKARPDPRKALGLTTAAAPDTERYFGASENALSKWVYYAIETDRQSREQLGRLVALICSRPDLFEIVEVEYPAVHPCKPERK